MPLSSDAYQHDQHWMDQAARHAALQGGSKSFAAAARLLPRRVRQPAVALYAFCREADDAIDSGTGTLASLRERLHLAYEGRPLGLPADRGMAWVVSAFAIPPALPEALLEGFAWDEAGRRYHTLSELLAYAVRVAGTVGVMMALLMGVRDAPRLAAAVDLGLAMQLSNIIRDVGEDARNGRLYLPLDWLRDAGIDPDAFLARPAFSPALGRVIARLLAVAEDHYDRAGAGISRLPAGCRFGIAAARLLYAEIGHEVARHGLDSVSTRAVVGRQRKRRVLAAGLPGLLLPRQRLAGQCAPEGAFLVEAVLAAIPPAASSVPWWAVGHRAKWTLDLFEQLERREWQQS